MSDDIRIPISFPVDTRGAITAAEALERLARAQAANDTAQQRSGQTAADVAARARAAAAAMAGLSKDEQQAARAAEQLAQAQNKTAQGAASAAAAEAKHQQALAGAAAAQARAEATNLRLAAAQEKATAAVKRTSDGLAILPRSFAGLTDELQSQVSSLVGWGAALGAGAALAKSFGDAFQFKAELDATTHSVELQLAGVRDSGQVFAEAAAFGKEYAFTQQEMTGVTQASVGILRTSTSSFTDLAGVLARMQVLAPGKSIEDAAFSVRELASGDITSIAEQFNISRGKAYEMRDAIAAGGDVVQVLKTYLDGAGVSMDTLTARTEGTLGKMNELKQAQEELKLAQAEWAQGPGLAILEAQINVTRDATKGLGGDVISLNQILEDSGVSAINPLIGLIGGYNDAVLNAGKGVLEWAGILPTAADGQAQVASATAAATEQVHASAGAYDVYAQAAAAAIEQEKDHIRYQQAIGEAGPVAQSGLFKAASGADAVAQSLSEANGQARVFLSLMGGVAGMQGSMEKKTPQMGAGNAAAAGKVIFRGFGANAGAAASGAAVAGRLAATSHAGATTDYLNKLAGVGGGRKGEDPAKKAAREAKAADTASERAQDILNKQADHEADLARKREKAAGDLAEKLADIKHDEAKRLADIAKDEGKKLADIDKSTADKQAELATTTANRLQDVARQAGKRLADIRKSEAAALQAIDDKANADREQSARDLTNSIASTNAQTAFSDAANNLDLAGASDDPKLKARESAEAARKQGLAAAAARAQAESDPSVGKAIYDTAVQALNARQQLDEQYAQRKAELEDDPEALAALDSYYQQAVALQQVAIAEQEAEARQAAELKIQQLEADKEAARQAAADERAAVMAEKRQQTAEIAAEAEAQRKKIVDEAAEAKAKAVQAAQEQRDEVATKVQEQTEAANKAFSEASAAIDQWATDAETDIQRVIDKLDGLEKKAYDAAAAVDNANSKHVNDAGGDAPKPSGAPGGGGSAPPKPPGRAVGGPVAAGQAYTVGERGQETFVPATNGYILPYVAGGAGGASSSSTTTLSIAPGAITIVQQPGQDATALAGEVLRLLGTQTKSRGLGFG